MLKLRPPLGLGR
jgi:hypothetical protein